MAHNKVKKTNMDFQRIVDEALKLLPGKAPVGLKNLLKILAAQILPEDYELFDSKKLADMALSHWELTESRVEGAAKIRIHSPGSRKGKYYKTVIDIVSEDLAFLIDSVIAEVNKSNLLIDLLIHPVVYTKRSPAGKIQDIYDDLEDGRGRQCHIHIRIKQALSDEALVDLEQGLLNIIDDVYVANRDWRPMLQRMDEAKEGLANAHTRRSARELEKYCAFLDYLYENNFTFLGYREYQFVEKDGVLSSKTLKGQGLGVLANDVKPAYISENKEGLPRNLQEMRKNLDPISISKTNRLSTVHRSVPMDAVAIKVYDDDGQTVGEKLFLGLFTSVTYSRSVSSVPYLREKVEEVIDLCAFEDGSHDRKALRHILEKYPRDELFQIDVKELKVIGQDILRLQEKQRIALFVRKDPFGRCISCLIYIPRDRFSSELRANMIAILERELDGECAAFFTNMDDSLFARVSVTVNVSQSNPPVFKVSELEALLQECGKTWQEKLYGALFETYDDNEQIVAMSGKYGTAFPVAYAEQCTERQAVFDIDKIETVLETGRLQLELYCSDHETAGKLRLKIYNPGAPVTLSDVMPILDNMGLRAIAELPFEISPAGSEKQVWIHDFLLEIPGAKNSIVIPDVKHNFERAFTKVWYNATENDGLNRLILTANMNWHEITVLRSYVRYLKQIRFPFSRPYTETALTSNPLISRILVDYFKAYHNPKTLKSSAQQVQQYGDKIDLALETVESLDEDRILRTVRALIDATLRTNYYQRQDDGTAKTYLSLKISSQDVPDLPEPRPLYEIFVYSPQVEGIHLRGNKIARGGLRWSDRHEDFRTEVLGLMKAQMVKNAVIVPTGSKGGFVVKAKGLKGREAVQKEGVACYKVFIRGLLDLTDNRLDGKVVPPENVVRRDEDDPYLVVAADKGTATFSDIANGLSEEYGFWMADAFASGGSAGYDHKKMGITARGAWESVKTHFRGLNHNTQEKPFEVVGVGDMGGDVFGNGMLLSEHIRLIGAFNHLHIFCDPDPNQETGYKERKRLFDAVKGWGDYNKSYLSKGGMVYSRSDKVLVLTPEIKDRFGLTKDKVSPNDLMKAMLKARTDLLWFGGIGTYIKASSETHADVGDKASDALRIDAGEVGAKVIGEGANLGVTQLGRVEFAEKGGKINTDFLDNVGGVDCSDHEVNIKILLTDVMRSKKHNMDIKARNKLLESMTGDVADLVLRSNYQQAQAISLAELSASESLKLQEEFIRDMEREEGLSRKIEGLPDDDAIAARLSAGKGLTRPELCVILSYAKIGFTGALLNSDIPDNSDMEEWIVNYFPPALREPYKAEIMGHQLKREIIATTMSNSLVNRMGPTFLKSRMNKTGASVADIAEAYIIVREAFDLRTIWDALEALDNQAPAQVQLKAMREISNLCEYAITWFLTRLGRKPNISADVKAYGQGIKVLQKELLQLVDEDLGHSIRVLSQSLCGDGLPEAVAQQVALLPTLTSACDLIKVSLELESDLLETARVYFELGQRFHLDWLRQKARFLKSHDSWQSEATSGLVDQLYSCQAGMTRRVLRDTSLLDKKDRDSLFVRWMQEHEGQARQLDPLFAELHRAGSIDLAMLVIAEQRLRHLYGG